jgi:TonB-dependent starch-binding outer membrane protein SusC
MVKNPLQSISNLKCLKKIMLIFGISSLLLIQGLFQVLAASDFSISESESMQQKNVTGRVNDSNNNPLAGVNIVEKGTTNGVLTGADGSYAITVASANSILTFSFIGYEIKEVTVGNQKSVNMTLTDRKSVV